MDIRVLARREKRAEANRRTAEEIWRKTWWETTLALGHIGDKAELAEACTVLAEVTGKSLSWIRSRAKTGKAFIEAGVVATDLPPRMAVELVSKKVELTDEVVEGLRTAEAEGMSLREFSASLTGKAWSDTAEGASEEKISAILSSQPGVVTDLLLENEELFRQTQDAYYRKKERERMAARATDFNGRSEILPFVEQQPWRPSPLAEIVLNTKALRRMTDGQSLTDEAKANIRWVIAELTAIVEGEEFIGDLESWLEEVTS